MLGNIGGWHALIIAGIVLLLFGATKLPALSKGLGQSINIFRKEVVNTSPTDPNNEDGAPTTNTRTP